MRRDPQFLAAMAAGAALLASVLQLLERDLLRGMTGLAIAATFGVIAADLPQQSRFGRWLAYGFLLVAFALLGIRLFSFVTRTA